MSKYKIGLLIAIAAFSLSGCSIDFSSSNNSSTISNNSNDSTISNITNISLNFTSRALDIGETTQIYTTVSPSDAEYNLTYSSSDASIASVNDEGLITGISSGEATITVSETGSNIITTCEVTVSDKTLDAWTIMIYMCGADLESGYDEDTRQYYYLASSDIKEMLSVNNKPDNINIIIQTGGAKKWSPTYGISSSKLERWEVKNNSLNKVDSLANASMGKTSTFQSFLEWGLTNYPASRTGLIMWNHGGAMGGVCYDENYNDDALTDFEVKEALTNTFYSVGRKDKLEWIGYDACLMQVQDVAEFNSGYFNYMVASQESEEGYGWDYDVWLKTLYSDPLNVSTSSVLKSIVDSFIEDNGGVSARNGDQTLSYLNLNKIGDYKDAWENMASDLTSILEQSKSNVTAFNKIINNTKYFGDTYYYQYCVFDAKNFLTLLQQNSTFKSLDSISTTLSAFEEVVEYNVAQTSQASDAYGLSFFYVVNKSYGQLTYTSSAYSNFTNWNNLSKTYGTSGSSRW